MKQPLSYALRLAVRGLSRSRGTTVIAMVTLGVGLAAAVALLGVADSGLRPLPVPAGGDIVELQVRNARAERVVPRADVAAWTEAPGVVEAGALRQISGTLLHPGISARTVHGAAMHTSVLRLLQVPPALGRLPADDVADAATMMLGWDLYEELGGDPSVLGSVVHFDDVAYNVIGVMPDGFGFPENHSFWTLLPRSESGEVVARMVPGADRGLAGAALAARLDAIAHAEGGDGAPHRVDARNWTTSRDGDSGEGAVLAGLGMLVGLLLLVCCANVATLLLVRGTERANVLAVQSALGASRGQVTFQLMVESLIIALGGGLIGLGGGFLMLRWMELKLSSHWGYYWMVMEVRLPVLLATVALVLLTALAAGTVPAIRASRVDVAGMLVGQGRGRGDPRQRRMGRWFVGAQVALSSLGMIAAILLAREFAQIGRITERLPLDDVAVARLTLPDMYQDAAVRADLVERLRAELGRAPAVADVSISNSVPGGPGPVARLHLPGADPDVPAPRVNWAAADPRMQSLYRMRLVAGRPLAAGGRESGVLVTEGVAQRYFGGAAVGERLRLAGVHSDDVWVEIVGVVQDWFPEHRGVFGERVIVPMVQASPAVLYVSLASRSDAGAVVGHVREAVRRADERIAVDSLQTLRDRMNWFMRMMKVIAGFGMLGGVGSALVASIGLYGVMSFQVRTRKREIGIRMAVGAAAPRIAYEVITESMRRVAPGLVAGIGLALFAVPVILERSDGDPAAAALRFIGIAALAAASLLVIGAVAAVEPALRAARLDPQEVLRAD